MSELSRCPACGGPLAPWRQVPSSDRAAAPGPFHLLRCGRCGSAVTVEPAPAEAHETGAYGGGAPRLYRVAAPLLAWFDRRRLRLVRRTVPPPARLLDAGAGRGRFVASAATAGYAAAGIEPSARGIAGARELGARVTQASIDSAEIDDGAFDAVTLWHVLEHLEDPGSAIETIARWLRPGGALLVGVPNLGSLQARIGGERWYHLDVPRHRIHFTTAGITSLLAAHGLTVVHTTHVLAEQNPFGMWQSLVSRVTREPSYLYHLLKRNAPVASRDLPITLLALPLVPVAALLELAAGVAGRGGTIAVLARRVSDPASGAEYD